MSGQPESEYGPRRAAYDIKKLRAKGIVSKIGKSRRYESVLEVIHPAGVARYTCPSNPIDQHYESLRDRMHELFTDLGIAA
jgi:hypothetical protein